QLEQDTNSILFIDEIHTLSALARRRADRWMRQI
ncbi:hypothetical protein SEEH4359_15179, partial [Salmonella enterica subsp. enterica serovar Heidelberg str. CVM24359]